MDFSIWLCRTITATRTKCYGISFHQERGKIVFKIRRGQSFKASEQSPGAATKLEMLRIWGKKRICLPAAFPVLNHAGEPPASQIVIEMPSPITLRIRQD